MMDEFNIYLKYLLNEAEIDSDVYSSFIISILNDSDLCEEYQQLETEKTLSDLFEPFQATIVDTKSFTKEIISKYRSALINNMNLNKQISSNCIITADKLKATNIQTDNVFEFLPPECAESVEYQSLTTDDNSLLFSNSTHEFEENVEDNDMIDAHGEELQNLYNNYMHWMYLIDQVDSKANYSPSEKFSADAISCALHTTDSDIDKSVEALFYTKRIADTCKPCRHALASRCMRKDCYFDHNLSEIPCRFWLLDVCLKHQASHEIGTAVGENACPFQHAVLSADSAQTSTSSLQPNHKSLANDDSHFPALMSSSSSSKCIGNPIRKTKYVRNVSAHDSKNYKAAVITSKAYRSYACPTISAVSDTPSKYKGDSSSWWQSSNNLGSKNVIKVNSPSIAVLPSEWVESGQSVAVHYATLRCDAVEYAKGRNKLLEAATRAYLLGDRAAAKNLSNEGQRLNALMKDCHEKAAQQIFRTRNSSQSLLRGQIDLHGLHVAEAQECISVIVPMLEQMNVKQVHIVTGTGHHTVGPQRGVARLMPSVQSTLDGMGYRTTPVKDANGYIGGFQIVYQSKRS